MKQKDIALIIVIVAISAALSYVLSGMLISSPKNRKEQVEVVPQISADFSKPDQKYFNKDAVDPTRLIKIGEDSNTKPFQ